MSDIRQLIDAKFELPTFLSLKGCERHLYIILKNASLKAIGMFCSFQFLGSDPWANFYFWVPLFVSWRFHSHGSFYFRRLLRVPYNINGKKKREPLVILVLSLSFCLIPFIASILRVLPFNASLHGKPSTALVHHYSYKNR